MKTRQDIESAILDSLCLKHVQIAVVNLNSIYQMPCRLDGDRILFIEDDFSIEAEVLPGFITGLVQRAPDDELLENYCLLTGVRHIWITEIEESDCQPQRVAKPLGHD